MLPDLDSIALFVRAAELRSLTKAAEASHLALAAASRRIALLENRFKTPLLERSPRGVEVTPAGMALLVHAKELLMVINRMQADMNDHATGVRGSLRIWANTSAMTEFLPADLADFTFAHPEVRLVVEERWSAEIVKAVLAAEADMGIIVEGQRADGLEIHPYRSDRIAVVMRGDNPLATSEAFSYDDVLEHDVVALEGGSSMMRLLSAQAAVAEKPLRLRIQVRSFEAVCRMVQSGLGLGLLPFQAASELGKGMNLVVRPLPEPWAERRMFICVRSGQQATSTVGMLLKHFLARTSASAHVSA
jgi:DNA-binding transcriptional LysR family regulator